MAIHFNVEPDAIAGMLQYLIQKGVVKKYFLKESCEKTCYKCGYSIGVYA
jgi:hypothetical protein